LFPSTFFINHYLPSSYIQSTLRRPTFRVAAGVLNKLQIEITDLMFPLWYIVYVASALAYLNRVDGSNVTDVSGVHVAFKVEVNKAYIQVSGIP
jgi:hypothetical protein